MSLVIICISVSRELFKWPNTGVKPCKKKQNHKLNCLPLVPKTATAPAALPNDFTAFVCLLSKCINCAIWMQTDKPSSELVVELKSISFHKLPSFCSPLNMKTKQNKNTNMRRQREHYILFFFNTSNSNLDTIDTK